MNQILCLLLISFAFCAEAKPNFVLILADERTKDIPVYMLSADAMSSQIKRL